VDHDWNAVVRELDIQLHPVRSLLAGEGEGAQRVLRRLQWGASVPEDQGMGKGRLHA
jgi:hypothetical protein